MDKKKTGFILFHEYAELLADLTDAEMGVFMRAIFVYETTGGVPAFKSAAMKMAFGFIKKDLDNNRDKWDETCQKRAEAGRKGGLAKSSKSSNATTDIANLADKDKDHSCDNEREKDVAPPAPPSPSRAFPLGIGQQAFHDAFPKKAIDADFDYAEDDVPALIAEIRKSDFLRKCNNLGLRWCLDNYDQIMSGFYRDYKSSGGVAPPQGAFLDQLERV